jgi:hypothetical protein
MAAIFKCDTCGNDTEPYPMERDGKHTCMKCLKVEWEREAEQKPAVAATPEQPVPEQPQMSFKAATIMVLTTFACLGLFVRCMVNMGHSQNYPSQQVQQQAPPAQQNEWNEGGNLHKATGKEWQAAGADNRLATASDFVASQKDRLKHPFTTVEELKNMSIEMAACITEATKPPGDTQQVSGIAAMCIITMGWI